MKAQTTKLYNWALAKAESERSPIWLSLIFFLEIFLFIPMDPILMFFCLQNRRKTFKYVVLATLFSTMSGFVGYMFGHFLWDLVGPFIVPSLISEATFETFSHHFLNYGNLATFVGGALPFPLKAVTLSAGAFQIGILPFITYFLSARLLRFLVIGGSMLIWGDQVKSFLDKHFQKVFAAVGIKIAIALLLFWFFTR